MSQKIKLLMLLFSGLLSVFYAEVLAGSSILWFLSPFGYIFLLPLYMFHLLVLYNLAVRFNRTSASSLYLFGVLFGLYETWVTKVAWAGFVDGQPVLGTPYGFAIAEMSIVTFFWHPFMSFLAPLITIKILSLDYHTDPNDEDFLGGISRLTKKDRMSILFYYYILIFSSGALALNSGGSIIISYLGIFVSLSMAYTILFLIKRRDSSVISLDSLLVGNKGLFAMIFYLAAIYILFYFNVRLEDMPTPLTLFLTILFYALIVLLIYLDKESGNVNYVASKRGDEEEIFTKKDLFNFYTLLVILVPIFIVFITTVYVMLVLMFLVTIIIGFWFIFKTAVLILLKRIR